MTTTTATPTQIIKTDSRGRLRMSAERRESLLDEFERSGASGAKFAQLMGIKYPTFANWVQRRRRQRGPSSADVVKPADSVRWLEAVVEQARSGGSGSVRLVVVVAWGSAGGDCPRWPGGVGGGPVAGLGQAMLSFSGSLKVFVAVDACDMRKGFNGLYALVTERLGEDPRQGALFVFSNRRHTRIKILCWDGTGLWVLTKRLERGTFSWPKHLEPATTKLKLTPQVLALLTDGVDLRGAKLRPWDERES